MQRYLIVFAAASMLLACKPGTTNTDSSAQASSTAPMTVQQAAQQWGLIGTWASDCSQPAGPGNEHATYALESDGTVSLSYDDGPGIVPNRYGWNQGLILSPDKLQLDGTFYGDNQAQHTELQKNEQGQMRVFGNVDGTGKVLVLNGAFPSGGAPGWDNKCQ